MIVFHLDRESTEVGVLAVVDVLPVFDPGGHDPLAGKRPGPGTRFYSDRRLHRHHTHVLYRDLRALASPGRQPAATVQVHNGHQVPGEIPGELIERGILVSQIECQVGIREQHRHDGSDVGRGCARAV